MIGIIAAMESEMAYFRERLDGLQEEILGGLPCCTGTLDGREIAVAQCGVGKVNAAMHTQMLIDRHGVTALIQTGIGGSLSPAAPHLAMVIGSEMVYHDMQRWVLQQYFPHRLFYRADEKLLELARRCAPEDSVVGIIATGDRFVDDAATKESIVRDCGALCCEMEGAAVAQVAALNGLPCLILRCISDMADGDAGMTFQQFEHIAAEKAAKMVHRIVREL